MGHYEREAVELERKELLELRRAAGLTQVEGKRLDEIELLLGNSIKVWPVIEPELLEKP